MSYKHKVPCRHPGCPNLVEPGQQYCEEHRALNPEWERSKVNKKICAWDENALAELLKNLETVNFDLALTGFDALEIESLFNEHFDKDIKDDGFDVEDELKKNGLLKAR